MFLTLLLACTQTTVLLKDDTGGGDLDDDTAVDTGSDTVDTGDTGETQETGDTGETEEDTSMWDDATLVIHSPASGAFLPWAVPSTFSATVYDATGAATDFDEITWTSDIDSAWGITGREVEDDALDVGVHALTATARLPNGDRLAYTVGGVLVQSPYAGVYTGTLTVNLAYDKYAAGCAGGATLVVDAYGETVTGESACVLSLAGYELDTSWVFDYANTTGALDGTAGADLTWFTYDFDSTGTVTEEGELTGSWAGDVYGTLTVDGSFEATRVSRDVPME